MITTNKEYDCMVPVWDFMRDSWAGQSRMRKVAERKNYYKRRSNFTDSMAERYICSGRYPNLVSTMVNQGVNRVLSREPQNMEKLQKYVNNPEKFLSWLLKQVAIVGGAGVSMTFNNRGIQFVPYNIEAIPNWSERSIAFEDKIPVFDKFGFQVDENKGNIVLWMNGDSASFSSIHVDEDGIENEKTDTLEYNGRELSFIPACRICTEDKPVFHGLAESSIDYFLVTALRNYILHQMVPQPVLYLPDEEKISGEQLSKYLQDKIIEYAAGTTLILPYTSKFEIVSPVVRPLGEMRQELILIKDEMITQGVNTHLQRGGQIGNMNTDTVRLHMNDQMLSFHDVFRQTEWAINKLLSQAEFLENGDGRLLEHGFENKKDRFSFKDIDFGDPVEIEDLIKDLLTVSENRESNEGKDDLLERVVDELEDRGVLSDS